MTEPELLMEIRERLVRVETKIDNFNSLASKLEVLEKCVTETESRSKSNSHRIDDIEENNKWLWRTIAGALIVAAIAAFVTFG